MKIRIHSHRSLRLNVSRHSAFFSLSVLISLSLPAAFAEDEEIGTNETVNAESAAVKAKAEEAEPEFSLRPKNVKPKGSGSLRLEYEYQKMGESTDNDLNGRLFAKATDLYNGQLDLYTSMRLYQDLDKPETFSFAEDPFVSLSDEDGVTDDRVLQLYADVHNRDKNISLRAGRQYVDIADYLQFDGGQLLINERKELGGRVYFGHPVSYYTSVSGDYAGGLSLVGRPWEDTRVRFTFARYYDDSVDDSDQNYFLDLRQQFNKTSRARAQVSYLNDEYRYGRADYYYYSEDGVTDFSAGYSYWGSFDAATRAYSPLYSALGKQEPYTLSYARLTRMIVKSWYVSPGATIRVNDDMVDFSNRDYEKYDVALIFEPTKAFSSSLALEYWSVESDDSFVGLTGDIRYRKGRDWEISGGAAFAEYQYDTFSDISYVSSGGQTVLEETGTVIQETPFVYTYYLRGKWRITRHLILRTQGDIEDNEEFEDLAYRIRGSVEVKF